MRTGKQRVPQSIVALLHMPEVRSPRRVARTGLTRSIYRSRWNARTRMPADSGAGHMSFHPIVCGKTHGRESSAAIMRARVVYKKP
jgi:hypothetical protein